MGRTPCCDKASVKKGPWSPEEDTTLKSYIEDHGPVGNWIALPQKIGLKRCGKSCRLRWLNYLRPNIKHGGFSEEEDKIICSLYISIGSRWSIIAAQLPGRTDNDIKNYWNTKLKKKLLGKQRNKEHQIRRNSSKRDHITKMSPKNENFSVISGVANEYWSCEVPGEQVNSVPLTCMNQNPNLICNQASMRELLVQLGGLRSPPNQEEETSPINTYFLDYNNDMIPTNYYPVDRSTLLASSRPSVNISYKTPLSTRYGISKVDNIVPVVVDDIMFPVDFSLDGPHTSSIYSADEMIVNESVCSSGLRNIICEGSSMIWEDISSLLACPPLLCDYECANNYNSQSLGGGGRGRGIGDSSFEESRLYVGQC